MVVETELKKRGEGNEKSYCQGGGGGIDKSLQLQQEGSGEGGREAGEAGENKEILM